MNIKEDPLYKSYLIYLEYRKLNEEISIGESKLLKLSGYYFDGFKNHYNTDEIFKRKVDSYIISKNRDVKINEIMNEQDILSLSSHK